MYTHSMPTLEGFPQGPNNYELPPETIQKIKGFNQAAIIWSAIEKGEIPPVPDDMSLHEEIVSSLEFLKEKNQRQYTPEQEAEQFTKVDAYIAKVKESKEGLAAA